MRILVVGAGAVGGYFGGRLLAARCDVTFLVRERRAAELAKSGLVIRSSHGDVSLPNPPTVQAEQITAPFDLVLLSCKAYDLDDAMASFDPAVGPGTAILPVLNGMRHLDILQARFGADHVLGGQCLIAATRNDLGEIVHLNETHELSFGELAGGMSDRVRSIGQVMQPAAFDVRASDDIVLDMWSKWVFLASLASATCLMRGSVGEISASPGGIAFVLALIEECRSIAAAAGYEIPANSLERTRKMLTANSGLTSSMLRDLEQNRAIEADHIVGDLLSRRGPQESALSLLGIAYTHLKAYEARHLFVP